MNDSNGVHGVHDATTQRDSARVSDEGLHARLVRQRAFSKLFDRPTEPVRIDRYVLLEHIGEGAMGAVYSAFDERLDRRVALKFMSNADTDDAAFNERFIREAKAMARISHPNVVAVYDAGRADDEYYIAMELVSGPNLRAWLAEEPERPWREVVERFVEAGAGLRAAHEAGIVHRDFKPANVLCTPEGVLKVADFGLAGLQAATDPPALGNLDLDELAITGSGQVLGTPLYMSPEQFAGEQVDERSDQFSFCVALYMALHGAHPFGGDTPMSLAVKVREGRIVDAPKRAIPSRLEDAVCRGLRVDPAERWATMSDLLAELRRTLRPLRWSALAIGALAVTTAASVAWASGVPNDECPTAKDYAAQLSQDALANEQEGVAPVVGGLVKRWAADSTRACAAHQRGEMSSDLFDLTRLCLDEARVRIEAMSTSPSAPGAASEVVGSVEDTLARCEDEVALTSGPTVDSIPDRDAWLGVRRLLSRASIAVAQHDIAREDLDALRQLAKLDQPDLDARAEALYILGRSMKSQAAFEEALGHFNDASAAADAAGNDVLRARVLLETLWLQGVDLADARSARRVANGLQGVLRRAGLEEQPAFRAELHSALGMTEMQAGDLEAAVAELAAAVDEAKRANVPPQQMAAHQGNLALARLQGGDASAAADVFRDSLDPLRAAHGEASVPYASALNNLGVSLMIAGRHVEALEVHQRSLAVRQTLHGKRALPTANAYNGIGLAQLALGDHAAAIDTLERSLSIRDGEGRAEDLAEAEFGLARALLPSDPDRSRVLARSALSRLSTPGRAEASAAERTQISRFLENHPSNGSTP